MNGGARCRSRRSSWLLVLACMGVLAACNGGTDEPGQSAADGVRLRVDGLTLVWPAELFTSVEGTDVADSTVPGAEATRLTVEFLADEGTPDGELAVAVVRSPSGAEVPDLSAEDRSRLVTLEALGDGSGSVSDGRVLQFVNGVGVRTLDESDYRFEGLTTDGRFLVEFSATAGDDQADRLDEMISTIFVDGASAVYATEDCEDGIELITENGLPAGASFAPGAEVTATWELRNTGTCTWGADYSWVFTGGEPLTVLSANAPADVVPGASAEVSVVFLAPEEPGQFAAQWQLQSVTDLEPLGTPAFVRFAVDS